MIDRTNGIKEIEVITLGDCKESTFDYTPATIDAWYDRHTRDWCIQILNKDGYDVMDCIRVGDKESKDAVVRRLRAEYNI